MAKAKILKKQKALKNKSKNVNLKKFSSGDERFKDSRLIKEVLVEALMGNDIETFKDVLIAHLRSQPKTQLASETKLGRQTLYDLIDESKEFNPTLSTLSLILKSIAA